MPSMRRVSDAFRRAGAGEPDIRIIQGALVRTAASEALAHGSTILVASGGDGTRRSSAYWSRIIRSTNLTPARRSAAHAPGPEAVEQLAGDGIFVFLTGHLHVTFAGATAKRYNIGGRSAIIVEAGTATSTRVRGEPNAFNVLVVEQQVITVEHRVWEAPSRTFITREVQRFTHTSQGWMPDSA